MEKLTKKEIIKKLKELEIEHDPKSAKEDLIALFPEEEMEEADNKEVEEVVEKVYIVVYKFRDLKDDNKIYNVGDTFDSKDKSDERLQELSSTDNKIGKILIKVQG